MGKKKLISLGLYNCGEARRRCQTRRQPHLHCCFIFSFCSGPRLLLLLFLLLPHRSACFPQPSSRYSRIFHLAQRQISTSKCFTLALTILPVGFPLHRFTCFFLYPLTTGSNLVAVNTVTRDTAAARIHPRTRSPLTLS